MIDQSGDNLYLMPHMINPFNNDLLDGTVALVDGLRMRNRCHQKEVLL